MALIPHCVFPEAADGSLLKASNQVCWIGSLFYRVPPKAMSMGLMVPLGLAEGSGFILDQAPSSYLKVFLPWDGSIKDQRMSMPGHKVDFRRYG